MSSQLPNKLLQYEVSPPPGVWIAIEQKLNGSETSSLGNKLMSFEEQPPAVIWSLIENSLEQTETPPKPTGLLHRMPWLRYAAAAIILLTVAAGIATFALQKKESGIAQQQQSIVDNNPSNTTFAPAPSEANSARAHDEADTENFIDIPEVTGTDNVLSKQDEKTAGTKRYLTVALENGEKVRLSKKVYPVFDCADNATASLSKRCKENIKNMQQKMATTLASPTTDFTGLIDMIKTLEENK